MKHLTKTDKDTIARLFKDNELYYEWSIYNNSVVIEVEWGDWKHDHLRLDYLMNNRGYKLVEERMTEEDGSDCYSSVHYYQKI